MSSNTNSTQTHTETRPILHLRNREKKKCRQGNNVRWTEDVVDNENMDKKKSKICCIFHPQREFGESSSESSGSSSDESGDEGAGGEGAGEASDASGAGDKCCGKHGKKHKQTKKSGPNAYEKQPTYKSKPAETS